MLTFRSTLYKTWINHVAVGGPSPFPSIPRSQLHVWCLPALPCSAHMLITILPPPPCTISHRGRLGSTRVQIAIIGDGDSTLILAAASAKGCGMGEKEVSPPPPPPPPDYIYFGRVTPPNFLLCSSILTSIPIRRAFCSPLSSSPLSLGIGEGREGGLGDGDGKC